MSDLLLQKPPRPWDLVDHGKGLRVGTATYRLGNVTGFTTGELVEPNVNGHLAAVGLFLGAGALFVLSVAMSLARPKFLIGGALFIGIGLTALAEVRRLRWINLFHADINFKDGETLRVTAPERAEIEALSAVLRGHLSARAA